MHSLIRLSHEQSFAHFIRRIENDGIETSIHLSCSRCCVLIKSPRQSELGYNVLRAIQSKNRVPESLAEEKDAISVAHAGSKGQYGESNDNAPGNRFP